MCINGKQPYKDPPKVVYGYLRVVRGDMERAAALKADLLAFCRTHGFMLGTVFADWGIEDTAVARPGFSSLLDVCKLAGSHGVLVPARSHLSTHHETLSTLTRQLQRTGVELIAADEFEAALHGATGLSINGLYKILTNAYYTGTVPFQGAYYEGTHEALVDLQTWLLVQQTLEAHNFAGEKEFVHSHYLKGSIWCGSCGSRLIFSRNKGKTGISYDYFVCIGRHRKRNDCTRKAVLVSRVEAGVEEFYGRFEVPPEQIEQIRSTVGEEFLRLRAVAETDMARSKRRLTQAKDQRQKLLNAHYEGAIPKDMLKSEMTRLTAEVAAAERELAVAGASMDELESQLTRALSIAGRCADAYQQAAPAIRRQFNQGFFKKLYIGEDGSVQEGDLNQPFAALLLGPETADPNTPQTDETLSDGQMRPDDMNGMAGRTRPSAVVVAIGDDSGDTKTPGQGILTRGSNVDYLAEAEGFEPPDGLPSPAFKIYASPYIGVRRRTFAQVEAVRSRPRTAPNRAE